MSLSVGIFNLGAFIPTNKLMKTNTFVVPIIRPDFIGRMLETLYKYTEPNFNVIVIDQTASREAQNRYEKLSHLWIRPYRNLGFAKAMNIGIRLSQTEYITLANDDIEFMNKAWWQGILDTFATDERIIAVNPNSPKEGSWGYGLTTDNHDTWQPSGQWVTYDDTKLSVVPKREDGSKFEYKEEFTEEDYQFLLNSHPQWQPGTLCDGIAMWCTIFSKEGLEKVGLLDEQFYPGGGEDYDMNCRAYSCSYPASRESCNPDDNTFHWRMVGTTKSWVWHHWGKSKDAISGTDPNNNIFASRKRWNANEELWPDGFDIWGHKDVDGVRTPLKRISSEPFVDEL